MKRASAPAHGHVGEARPVGAGKIDTPNNSVLTQERRQAFGHETEATTQVEQRETQLQITPGQYVLADVYRIGGTTAGGREYLVSRRLFVRLEAYQAPRLPARLGTLPANVPRWLRV